MCVCKHIERMREIYIHMYASVCMRIHVWVCVCGFTNAWSVYLCAYDDDSQRASARATVIVCACLLVCACLCVYLYGYI